MALIGAGNWPKGRTARLVAGFAAAGSLALMVCGLILAYLDRHLAPADVTYWDFSDVFGDLVTLAIPALGFILASRRPGNRIGWLALAAGLTLGLRNFTDPYEQRALVAAPGSLPAGPAALWLSGWIWLVSLAMVAFTFLLFPTGRLRSRRWRPAAWFVGAVFVLGTAAVIAGATPAVARSYGPPAVGTRHRRSSRRHRDRRRRYVAEPG